MMDSYERLYPYCWYPGRCVG